MAGRYQQVYSKQKRSKKWDEEEELARLRSDPLGDDEDDETCGIFCFGLGLILMFVGVAILATVIVYNQSDQNHGPVTSLTSTRDVKPVSKELTKVLETPNSIIKTISHTPQLKTSEKLSLLVIVRSLPNSLNFRKSIRETWMPRTDKKRDEVRVVFSIPAKGASPKELASLEEESRTQKDMVVFLDSNILPESELLLFEWVWSKRTFSFDYLLKVRDVMYVRLPQLMSDVVKGLKEKKSNAYLGYFEGNRDPKDSGKLDEPDWFLCDHFIRYAHSGGYILSEKLVERLVRQAKFLHPYNNEDVALGTWLSPFNDIDWIHEVRFDTETGKARGCKNDNLIFQTENHADMVVRHHKLIQTSGHCEREYENVRRYSYNFDTLPSQCCKPL
jgi:galactosylxylosylprotein 3-beta-galactosyltransferase